MRWVIGTVNAFSVIILVLLAAVCIPTFYPSFYSREYDKYKIPESIQMSKENLMTVTRHMLDYMKGKEENLSIQTVVDGQERNFFNERELSHMVDVKNLFTIGFSIGKTAVLVFAVTIFLLLFMGVRPLPVLARSNQIALIVFLVVVGGLAFFISRDFDAAFTLFHKLFFDNDLWILNPETDLLVNIVPIQFFVDIAIFVASIFLSSLLVIIGVCSVYLHKLS